MNGEIDASREDMFKYCPRVDREILVVGSVCVSRLRSSKCEPCIYDNEKIKTKLALLLADMLEDKWQEEEWKASREGKRGF